MTIEFQKEFPERFQKFTKQLYKKLHSKPYRPDNKPIKTKKLPEINWNLTIGTSLPKKKQKISKKKATPCVNTIMNAIHGHGAKQFQDEHGYYNHPEFTKAKIEQLLNIYIPPHKFQHLKKKMNEKQTRRKAKSIRLANLKKQERKNKFRELRELHSE